MNFKIGQEVKIRNNAQYASTSNKVGIVRVLPAGAWSEIGVDFGEGFNGHNLTGKLTTQTGYYVPTRDILEILPFYGEAGGMESINTYNCCGNIFSFRSGTTGYLTCCICGNKYNYYGRLNEDVELAPLPENSIKKEESNNKLNKRKLLLT